MIGHMNIIQLGIVLSPLTRKKTHVGRAGGKTEISTIQPCLIEQASIEDICAS